MKQLLYIICAVFLFTSCKKDTARIFEESPEERMAARIQELNRKLLESENGWKVSLTTNAKGGYGFYMGFEAGKVLMVGDLNATSATTPKTSTYRIKWVMNATLMFDTYNYISMLHDPSPSAYGGAAGSGLQSDVEWEYQRSSADTIVMRGFKYKNYMYLVKATAEEKARYLGAEFKANIDGFNNFFATHENNYFNIQGVDNKIEFLYDYGTRIAKVQYVDNGGAVKQVTNKFNFEDAGINFSPGFNVAGITLLKAKVEEDKLVLYAAGGTKYTIAQDDVFILPMSVLFAYNGTYRELYVGSSLPAGVTSAFNTAWQSAVTKFGQMNPARSIVDLRFTLSNSTTATVTIRSTNGTNTYIAVASYKYTNENGIITLSNPSYDPNWTPRVAQLIDIQNFFLSGPFRLDYVKSSNPAVTSLGGLFRVDDNNAFFYGTLRK